MIFGAKLTTSRLRSLSRRLCKRAISSERRNLAARREDAGNAGLAAHEEQCKSSLILRQRRTVARLAIMPQGLGRRSNSGSLAMFVPQNHKLKGQV